MECGSKIAAAREEHHMVRHALIAIALPILGSATAAAAQDGGSADQVKLGERLANQSCVVCHFAPQITSGTYAPALSKDSLGGKADIIHEVIANGTPRMPAFKYQFKPQQIDAIVAYIQTLQPSAAAPSPRKTRGDAGAD
jgi:mono/diheme cytochrome c family protein